MHKVVLATSNSGKLQELQTLLAPLRWEVIAQSQFAIPNAEETGLTFIENALLKARHAAQLSHLPALADDSGLIVDALNGAPGIYSARYAVDGAHIQKLLQALRDVPEEKRTARFHCVLAYLTHPHDPLPLIVQGTWEGRILFTPRGEKGFGYDPIFYVPTHNCSAAELSSTVKNHLSHRGQALAQLLFNLLPNG